MDQRERRREKMLSEKERDLGGDKRQMKERGWDRRTGRGGEKKREGGGERVSVHCNRFTSTWQKYVKLPLRHPSLSVNSYTSISTKM